jgi:hypothetical protein
MPRAARCTALRHPPAGRSPARGASPGEVLANGGQVRTRLAPAERDQALGDAGDCVIVAKDLESFFVEHRQRGPPYPGSRPGRIRGIKRLGWPFLSRRGPPEPRRGPPPGPRPGAQAATRRTPR